MLIFQEKVEDWCQKFSILLSSFYQPWEERFANLVLDVIMDCSLVVLLCHIVCLCKN